MAIYTVEQGAVIERTSGSTTIAVGDSYVDVTHHASSTPSKVRITPTSNLGTRSFWVSNKGANTFRVNINSTDIIEHTFDWESEV